MSSPPHTHTHTSQYLRTCVFTYADMAEPPGPIPVAAPFIEPSPSLLAAAASTHVIEAVIAGPPAAQTVGDTTAFHVSGGDMSAGHKIAGQMYGSQVSVGNTRAGGRYTTATTVAQSVAAALAAATSTGTRSLLDLSDDDDGDDDHGRQDEPPPPPQEQLLHTHRHRHTPLQWPPLQQQQPQQPSPPPQHQQLSLQQPQLHAEPPQQQLLPQPHLQWHEQQPQLQWQQCHEVQYSHYQQRQHAGVTAASDAAASNVAAPLAHSPIRPFSHLPSNGAERRKRRSAAQLCVTMDDALSDSDEATRRAAAAELHAVRAAQVSSSDEDLEALESYIHGAWMHPCMDPSIHACMHACIQVSSDEDFEAFVSDTRPSSDGASKSAGDWRGDMLSSPPSGRKRQWAVLQSDVSREEDSEPGVMGQSAQRATRAPACAAARRGSAAHSVTGSTARSDAASTGRRREKVASPPSERRHQRAVLHSDGDDNEEEEEGGRGTVSAVSCHRPTKRGREAAAAKSVRETAEGALYGRSQPLDGNPHIHPQPRSRW